MKQTNVLQLVSPNFGGIESYVFSHYQYMDREKVHFDFLTQNRALEGANQYRQFQYHVHLLQKTANQDQDLFVLQMRELLSSGYDVLHLNNCFWTGFLLEELAKEAGIRKVIVHSHSSFIDEPDDEKRGRLLHRHEEVKKAFTQDLATDFWACSWKAADWLFGPQIPRDKIRIMKNAIEIEKYQFDSRKRKHVRDELGLENAVVLGATGRLSYSKNPGFLLDVFAEFHQNHQNSRLLILGDGELRGELEDQIRKSGLEEAVLLLGWKTNVEDYLQAMDVFLLPSRFEGNPISLIEAVAAGLPTVIADTITEEAVITSTVYREPLDVTAWISALEEASQLRIDRQDGAEAVRTAGYDIKRQAKMLEALYEQ